MNDDLAVDPDRIIRRLANRIAELEVLCAQQGAAITQLVEQQARAGNTEATSDV